MPLKASAFLLHPLPTLPICPQPFPDSDSLQRTPPPAGLPTPAPPAHLSRSAAHCRKTQRLFKGQVHRHRLPFPPASCPPSVIPTPECHPYPSNPCRHLGVTLDSTLLFPNLFRPSLLDGIHFWVCLQSGLCLPPSLCTIT